MEQMLAAETRAAETSAGPIIASPPSPSIVWKQLVEGVEPFLHAVAKRLVAQAEQFEPEIAPYAHYALSAQGKHLRPILVSLSGESVGSLTDSHVTVAVIIEMVHLATLVHDDVIDEAALRRGRPTLAANWGNEISVLLGDCLFAHSLKLAASFPTPEICRAVASATNTVCAGEILQTQRRGNFEISRAEYFKILNMKTAELFALSCDLGSLLGQATTARREALRQYGMALGTAYQVYDDCLDLVGSEASAGKTLGADLGNGKLTLPTLIVRDRASAAERNQLRDWMKNWSPNHLAAVLDLIEKYEAFAESRAVIQKYLAAARQSILNLPASDGRTGLIGLTHYLAEQTEALGVIY